MSNAIVGEEGMIMTKSLTTGEVARICQVSQTTVLNWIRDRGLNAYTTPGGHYRIQPADLQAFAACYRMLIDWHSVETMPSRGGRP
jgi:excisionase family DNA binding protein